MSTAAQADKPPFKPIDWLPRDIALDKRADGTMVILS